MSVPGTVSSNAQVLVLGAGRLAALVIRGLLETGVRRIVVVDSASVSRSDVDDVFFTEADVGVRGRAEVLAERFTCDASVHIVALRTDIRRIDGWRYDLVITCSRTCEDRLRVNGRIRAYTLPLVDGVVSGSRGRVQTVVPFGPCLSCVISSIRSPLVVPAVREVEDMVAERMVAEAVGVLTGELDSCTSGVVYIDGEDMSVSVLPLGISPVCRLHGNEKWRQNP